MKQSKITNYGNYKTREDSDKRRLQGDIKGEIHSYLNEENCFHQKYGLLLTNLKSRNF